MSTDPRIDAYIAGQADFARPILNHLRAAVHAACPGAEEAIKWGMPAFLWNGQILAMIAAFKAHATFSFWRGKEVVGETGAEQEAMGQFGRLTALEDLPAPELLDSLIKRAMALGEAGPKPRPAKQPKPEIPVPDDLRTALLANDAANANFDSFTPSCRREYLEWITSAKRPETRSSRIAQTVEWVALGKRRNWKYDKA
ncbi:MAG TPA: YdeI/OmpD-associated family protein [Allosphingosinicella sp.]|jgi:uncharacterized protein YdeI (YjbR/CyaY-like superfamily)